MMSLKQRLAAEIEKRLPLAIKLTQDMVRLPSDKSEKEVAFYIRDFLDRLGLSCDVWEPKITEIKGLRGYVDTGYDYTGRYNVVSVIKGEGGGRSLALNGHMDVVPVDEVPWKHGNPFSGALEDGKIYGRGTLDMKGGLAAALIFLDSLVALGIKLKGDLHLYCVVDEENGGNGTLACLQRGYLPDGVIYLEGTSPELIVAANRGAQFFRITIKGREVSILRMRMYPNAIDKAMFINNAVNEYFSMRNEKASHPFYSYYPVMGLSLIPACVCTIKGGNWPSTLPGRVTLEGSLECLPGEDIEEVKKGFKDYILQKSREDEWLRAYPPEIEWFGLCIESAANELPCELAEMLQKEAEAVLGKPPVITGAGGCDLHLTLAHNIPSLLYGPGGSNEHCTDEYVDAQSIVQTATAVGRFALEWCGIK